MVAEEVALTGAACAGNTPGPSILRRTDRAFIPNVLSGLSTNEGRAAIKDTALDQASVAFQADGGFKLYQPVHQIFHVAMVQAFCQAFGSPRLDPARIDSCGLVVRRVSIERPGVMERWSKKNGVIVGWAPCPNDSIDPDPARRAPSASTGNAEIDRLLPLPASFYDGMTESVAPLFIAPPAACSGAKATILYGLVPVTSTEKSEMPPAPFFAPQFVVDHSPYFLGPRASRLGVSIKAPCGGEELTAADADDPSLAPVPDAKTQAARESRFKELTPLLNLLRQLKFEFGVFGDAPEGRAIFEALNQFAIVPSAGQSSARLGDFLKTATAVLIDRIGDDGGPPAIASVHMPGEWPDIPDDARTRIRGLIKTAMEARLNSIVAGEGRFDDADRQYRLRAFVRVKQPDGCLPRLIWSDSSPAFRIAAWHESSGLPPIKIQLPKITADRVKALKPNVAFAMDGDMFAKLQRDPKKSLKGEKSGNGGTTIEWICAFNIPVITICAFIVLNIFLSLFALFDFFFALALSIKLCIPIPVPKAVADNAGGSGS
ncbi:MAG: hypothetical protein ABSG46_19525 [Candidatus Binataceae bacterium]